MEQEFYTGSAWRQARRRALARDASRCTVNRLLGGKCHGTLHVHHIDPLADPLDLDNLSTVCAHHHPKWEALRRSIVRYRGGRKRCPHNHRYPGSRQACERRLNAAA